MGVYFNGTHWVPVITQQNLRGSYGKKHWLVERADDRERSVNFIVTKALMRAKAMEEAL